MIQILGEYELYRKIQGNNGIKKKLIEFLKKNLVLNEGVVGKDFSHLY